MNMKRLLNYILKISAVSSVVFIVIISQFVTLSYCATDNKDDRIRLQQETRLTGRARFHEKIGEIKEALKYMEQAVMLFGDSKRASINNIYLGELYTLNKEYNKAIDMFFKERKNPYFFSYLRRRELFYECLEETEKLSDEIEYLNKKMSENINDLSPRFDLISIYKYTGDYDKAIEQYKEIIEIYPMNWNYQMKYAELLEESGDQKKALEVYKNLFQRRKNDVYLIEKYGRLLANNGKNEEARTVLDNIVVSIDNVGQYRRLGNIYQELGMLEDSIRIYETGTKKTGIADMFLIEIGSAYEVKLNYKKAALYYRLGIEKKRRSIEAKKAIYKLIETEPDAYTDVMNVLSKQSIDDTLLSRELLDLRMNISVDFGYFSEGLEYAETYAAKYDPSSLLRFYLVMNILEEYRFAEQALRILDKGFMDSPEGKIAHLELLNKNWSKMRSGEDKEILEKSFTIDSTTLEKSFASETLKNYYLKAGKFNLSSEFFKRNLIYGNDPQDYVIGKQSEFYSSYHNLDKFKELTNGLNDKDPVKIQIDGIKDFFDSKPESGVKKIGNSIMEAPVKGNPQYVLSLLFLFYTSEREDFDKYISWRKNMFINDECDINEMNLQDNKGEIHYHRLKDMINYLTFGMSKYGTETGDNYFYDLFNSESVLAPLEGVKLIDELLKQGKIKEADKLKNEFITKFTKSPFLYEVKTKAMLEKKNE